MKKLQRLFIAILLFSGIVLNAQETHFSIIEKTNNTLKIKYKTGNYAIESTDYRGESGQIVVMDESFLPNEAGAPQLPSSSTFVVIPNGAQATLHVVSAESKTLDNINLLPAPEPQFDDQSAEVIRTKNMDIYSSDALYPAQPFLISKTFNVRGFDIVQVSVMPFQYNPITGELITYQDIELNIEYEGGSSTYGDPRYRTPEWDHILNDMLLNREVMPVMDYGERLRQHYENRENGCEYLIITPDNDDFTQLADSIRRFRIAQGIPTEIYTVSQCGGNEYRTIKNFIRNAYNTWDMPPAAVLILGDHNSDGTQGIVSYTMNNHPGGSGYNPYISDNAYSDMNNDDLPDIIVGRIVGRNHDELYHMIKKDLDYERMPPTAPNFYDQPITAMGFQLERWFQLCSEIVNGFWEYGLGKHPVRLNAIYEGTPGSRWSTNDNTSMVLNYFGPSGCGYIPQTMSHLTEWNANGSMVSEAINNGAFIIQHRDHGAEELWGEPGYSIGNIKRLVNKDLTFVMSNNCLTGRFNYTGADGCFAEAFHRHEHGALGLIAATEVSYSFVNDVYVWGVYDNMWPDFMPTYGTQHPTDFLLPAFGNASGKFFLQQSSWPTYLEGKEITFYLFHHFGDVFMNLYSEVPQNLDVEMLPVVVAGTDTYTIKADENSVICLSVNDQIIGFDYGTGETQQIAITPQEVGTTIMLTIKKQNYYRYEHNIAVIPAEGPYLIFNDYEIDDSEASQEIFDGNGQVDHHEFIQLGLKLHNVGSTSINDVTVTLSTKHPEVEITNGETLFNNIDGSAIEQVDKAFGILFDDFEDGERVKFYLDMNDGTQHFRDSLYITVNAPRLRYDAATLTDTEGNPVDRLSKGSTSLLHINIENIGHYKSDPQDYNLFIGAPFLDIAETNMQVLDIEAGASKAATFTVIMHDDAPLGGILQYQLSDTLQQVSEGSLLLGYTTEDFETAILNPSLQWNLGSGTKVWRYCDNDSYEGNRCLQSSPINNGSSCILRFGINCDIDDKISFWYKVSSQVGDKLILHVDSETLAEWEGETGWQYVEIPIKAGSRLIKLTYKKDQNGSAGDDCAYIDFIQAPPKAELILFAGDDNIVCPSNDFTPNAYCYNYKSIEWRTDGDGYFDDNNVEQPSYTPGAQDIENQSVNLTMTAISQLNETISSDQVTLSLIPDISNIQPEMPVGDTLIDLLTTTNTIYEIPNSGLPFGCEYETNTIRPIEAGEIEVSNEGIKVNWNPDFRGHAFIGHSYSNDCMVTNTTELQVRVINSTNVNDAQNVIFNLYPNPSNRQFIVEGEGILDVTNALGQRLVQQEIDGEITLQLPRGLYAVRLISGNTITTKQLVIQ